MLCVVQLSRQLYIVWKERISAMGQMELIKKELEEHLGKKIILKACKGRKKFVTRYGFLREVYPSLFMVDVVNGNELTSLTFTYSDILTKTVRITVLNDNVKFEDLKLKIS